MCRSWSSVTWCRCSDEIVRVTISFACSYCFGSDARTGVTHLLPQTPRTNQQARATTYVVQAKRSETAQTRRLTGSSPSCTAKSPPCLARQTGESHFSPPNVKNARFLISPEPKAKPRQGGRLVAVEMEMSSPSHTRYGGRAPLNSPNSDT